MSPNRWPYESEAEAKAMLSYPEYREWRAWALERPYPKRRKAEKVRPEPGVFDLADEEVG